jgi:hypothetical protein
MITKKIVKKLVKNVTVKGKEKTLKKITGRIKIDYNPGFERLKSLEGRIINLIPKLEKYPKIMKKGSILDDKSQVIPILQLFFLGKLKKGTNIKVQSTLKTVLGIDRLNFSLRLINLFEALNKEKITSLQVLKRNCCFATGSKNKILSFTVS